MNRKQKICLWIGIAAIVVMGLFPPWVLESEKRNFLGGFGESRRFEYRYTTEPGTYSWLNSPPENAKFVDLYRLGIQYFVVAVVTAGLIITLRDKKDEKEGKDIKTPEEQQEVKIITTKDRLVKKMIILVAVAVSFFVSGFLLCWYFIPDHYHQKTLLESLEDIAEDVRREQTTDANENWLEVAERKLDEARSKPPPSEGSTEDVTPGNK